MSSSDPYRQWHTVQNWVREGNWRALREQWQSQDLEMRQAILAALGECGNPQAIAFLIEGLQDHDTAIQDLAAQALGRLGETAVPVLTAAIARLGEPAALALTRIAHPAIVPPLLAVWSQLSDRGRAQVLAALHPWRDGAVLALLQQALTDPAPPVQREALIGLGLAAQQGEITDLQPLVPFLENPELAPAAIEALGRARAVSLLQKALTTASPAIAQAIATALARIGTAEALSVLATFLDTAVDAVPMAVLLARHGGVGHLVSRWYQQHPCFGEAVVRRELALVADDAALLATLAADADALVSLYARQRLAAAPTQNSGRR
ncbi:MAG: HEAT repeat domain-containing protein [Pseudanabaenaceae cyanobacterium]